MTPTWLSCVASLFTGRPVNLLTPASYLEVTMQITPAGERRLYTSKVDHQQQAEALVRHMLQATYEVANRYGIRIEMTPPKGAA